MDAAANSTSQQFAEPSGIRQAYRAQISSRGARATLERTWATYLIWRQMSERCWIGSMVQPVPYGRNHTYPSVRSEPSPPGSDVVVVPARRFSRQLANLRQGRRMRQILLVTFTLASLSASENEPAKRL